MFLWWETENLFSGSYFKYLVFSFFRLSFSAVKYCVSMYREPDRSVS